MVAAAGSVVMVNTVNYARDTLGGDQADVAVLLAANGFGTMLAALLLPRVLDRRGARPVLLAGAGVLVTGLARNSRSRTWPGCSPTRSPGGCRPPPGSPPPG
ncbi:Uncharacterised protein [Mycobacteroides abscessus subsp. abscessus]|nr:Uncharacterised protein [Mycobacteroides abscessus subsp. abscessus]